MKDCGIGDLTGPFVHEITDLVHVQLCLGNRSADFIDCRQLGYSLQQLTPRVSPTLGQKSHNDNH